MLQGTYIGKYTGKDLCGFKNNHEYEVEIDKTLYGYDVTGVYDKTEDKIVDAYIRYASEKSINTKWTKLQSK